MILYTQACIQVVLCRCTLNCLSTLSLCLGCAPGSEDDGKLLCTCENKKETCSNGTCRGDVCFYTWVQGKEERGCFEQKNYKEQCLTSFPSFFVHCCKVDHCNALTTPPPNISQYPLLLLYSITSHV